MNEVCFLPPLKQFLYSENAICVLKLRNVHLHLVRVMFQLIGLFQPRVIIEGEGGRANEIVKHVISLGLNDIRLSVRVIHKSSRLSPFLRHDADSRSERMLASSLQAPRRERMQSKLSLRNRLRTEPRLKLKQLFC